MLIPIIQLVDIFIHINLLVHFVRAFLMLAFAAMAFAITIMSTYAFYLFVFDLCTHCLCRAILQFSPKCINLAVQCCCTIY